MITILPIHPRVYKLVEKHGIRNKFEKQLIFLKENPQHPSLNVELLEPHSFGLFSFRIDRKYRATFAYKNDNRSIQIFDITVHYQ